MVLLLLLDVVAVKGDLFDVILILVAFLIEDKNMIIGVVLQHNLRSCLGVDALLAGTLIKRNGFSGSFFDILAAKCDQLSIGPGTRRCVGVHDSVKLYAIVVSELSFAAPHHNG